MWGALAIAKEEIFWYFGHRTRAPPKSVAKLYQSKNYVDPLISELVSYVIEMVDLIKYYKSVIQEYYIAYLKGCDHEKLNVLVNDIVGRGGNKLSEILKSIMSDMQAVTLEGVLNGSFNFDVSFF